MSITVSNLISALVDLVDNVNEDIAPGTTSKHFVTALETAEDTIAQVREGFVTLSDGDYTVEDSVWLTVGNISVRVYKTDEGVVCDMWPLESEDGEPLASTYAFFSDAGDET